MGQIIIGYILLYAVYEMFRCFYNGVNCHWQNLLRFRVFIACVTFVSTAMQHVHVCGLCLISFPCAVTMVFNLTNTTF